MHLIQITIKIERLSDFVNFSTAIATIANRKSQQQAIATETTMIRSTQSNPAPGTGKNAGKNKKKRANQRRRAAAKAGTGTSGTMTSQLGASRATVPQWCKIDIDQVANHAGGFVCGNCPIWNTPGAT